MIRRPPRSTLFPSPPLFRSACCGQDADTELSTAATRRRDGVLLARDGRGRERQHGRAGVDLHDRDNDTAAAWRHRDLRSEEHTSELQSPCNLVCRLLLEKKK